MKDATRQWTREEIERELASREIDWWHQIDLAPGVVTPGRQGSTREKLERLHLPWNLSGRSVLDIGAWDGAFSFECERRGAKRVVAVNEKPKPGLEFAREVLGSSVEVVQADLMSLRPEDVGGPFECVLFSGVLYHLPDPVGGLRRVYDLTAPGGLVILETDTRLNHISQPAAEFVETADRRQEYDRNWWRPNRSAVIEMCRQVGFSPVEIVDEPARDHPLALRLRGVRLLWRLCRGNSRLTAHMHRPV